MTQESMDLCLNIVSTPVNQKKKKSEKKQVEPEPPPTKSFQKKNLPNPSESKLDSVWKSFKDSNKQKDKTFVKKSTKKTDNESEVSFVENPNEPSTIWQSESSGGAKGGLKQKVKSNVKGWKVCSLFSNNPDIPAVSHRAVKPVQESVFTDKCFSELKIHPFMVKNLEDSFGLKTMTVVQENAIPIMLDGKDALVRSQTGSGKTLAFAIPVVQALQEIRPKINRVDGVLTIVIVPTRELALQIYEVFRKLVKSFTWLVPGYLVGGERRKAEKARLRKGITILIGTPGRLVDHVQNTKALKLNKIKWLVIDEADRMLDMGYEKDVATLVAAIKEQNCSGSLLKPSYFDDEPEQTTSSRQTVLLSATLTPAVERLAGLTLHKPVFVDASEDTEKQTSQSVPVFTELASDDALVLPQTLTQKYIVTPAKLRLVTLTSFILWRCKLTKQRKMLIFMATQDMVDYHTELLTTALSLSSQDGSDDDDDEPSTGSNIKIDLFKLHGNMKQSDRTEVFRSFRSVESGVLLCTDVASRGLDLPHVDCVVQYTGPTTAMDYVHRAGRTARGGEGGTALIFLTPSEVSFVNMLENHRIRLQEEQLQTCLNKLKLLNPETKSMEQAATQLQVMLETIVEEQRPIHEAACKAYLSWIRFYSSYPRDMRNCFNRKLLHLGHYAKSFALKEPPSNIGAFGKKLSTSEERPKKKRERPVYETRPIKPAAKRTLKTLMLSEYGSGFEPTKKKQKINRK